MCIVSSLRTRNDLYPQREVDNHDSDVGRVEVPSNMPNMCIAT